MRALLPLLLLAACGTPAVLRGPPGQASMAPPLQEPPIPAIAETIGAPRITLPVATPDGSTPLSPNGDRSDALSPRGRAPQPRARRLHSARSATIGSSRDAMTAG